MVRPSVLPRAVKPICDMNDMPAFRKKYNILITLFMKSKFESKVLKICVIYISLFKVVQMSAR